MPMRIARLKILTFEFWLLIRGMECINLKS